MARPKKTIDPEAVERLATRGLSAELIGAVLDVDHRTLERRFAPILQKGRRKRDASLMIKLFDEAMGKDNKPCNTAIAIFLAKNFLGMTDRPEVVVNVQTNAVLGGIPEERLLQYRRLTMEFNETEAAAKQSGQPPDSKGDRAAG